MSQPGMAKARWSTPAIASLVSVALVILAFSIEGIWSPDIWWQLSTGRLIFESGRVPTADVFSYTVTGHEWIELRWLFCLGTYLGWQWGGPGLLIAAKALILLVTFAMIAWPARRAMNSLAGPVLLALAVIASVGRFAVRPELITYLFLATFVVSLERLASDRCRRGLWFMPLAQIVWTNSHTLFILGPVVCWLYWVGSFIRPVDLAESSQCPRGTSSAGGPRFSIRGRLLATAMLASVACFANPYFLRGALFPFKLFAESRQSHFLSQHIDELRGLTSLPIYTWSWIVWAAALLFVIGLGTFLTEGRRHPAARLLVFLAFAYLALTSIRNLALFSMVAAQAGLMNLSDNVARRAVRDPAAALTKSRFTPFGQMALTVALLCLAWYAASNRFSQSQSDNRRAGLGVVEQNIPRQAVEFLKEAGASPEVYSSMGDSNYLLWAAHDKFRVYVDGRLEVYGDEFLREYFTGHSDIDALAARYGISTVIVQRDSFGWLLAELAANPQWALVHLDHRNLVYVKDFPANAGLIARYRIDPNQPFTPRTPEPDESIGGFARLIGGVGRPWYSVGMARTFLTFGAIDNAETYLGKALEHYPNDVDARVLMSVVQTVRGRPSEAERLVAGLSLTPAQITDQMFALSELLRAGGRYAEAVSALARARESAPEDVTILTRLAETCILAKDLPRAIVAFRAAIAQTPADARLWMRLGICLESQSDGAGAIAAYREAVRISPGLFTVQNQLGTLLARQGDFAGARKCFETALRIRPDYESAKANLERLGPSAEKKQ